jgi:hypothetical protein
MSEAIIAETAAMIADQLGETEDEPRRKITRIVKAIGPDQAYEVLQHAMQAEEHGGLMTRDGTRRRTLGGVWFYFAKGAKKKNRKKGSQPEAKLPQPEPSQPKQLAPFEWKDRLSAVAEAEQEKGHAPTVKITLIGRPGKIVDRGQCIVTVMESKKAPTLPKGLPTPTDLATKYAVYIAIKQWNKVKESIKDPEDILIIEGFPKTDAEASAIAVFATNVTTKRLQQAQKSRS